MKKLLFLSLLLVGCTKSSTSRIGGGDTTSPQYSTSGKFYTVSCCQDNTNGIVSYPPFVPASQVQLCETASHNNIINGDTYLPMHVDCGHGHHDIGDNYYPSSGY